MELDYQRNGINTGLIGLLARYGFTLLFNNGVENVVIVNLIIKGLCEAWKIFIFYIGFRIPAQKSC